MCVFSFLPTFLYSSLHPPTNSFPFYLPPVESLLFPSSICFYSLLKFLISPFSSFLSFFLSLPFFLSVILPSFICSCFLFFLLFFSLFPSSFHSPLLHLFFCFVSSFPLPFFVSIPFFLSYFSLPFLLPVLSSSLPLSIPSSFLCFFHVYSFL